MFLNNSLKSRSQEAYFGVAKLFPLEGKIPNPTVLSTKENFGPLRNLYNRGVQAQLDTRAHKMEKGPILHVFSPLVWLYSYIMKLAQLSEVWACIFPCLFKPRRKWHGSPRKGRLSRLCLMGTCDCFSLS